MAGRYTTFREGTKGQAFEDLNKGINTVGSAYLQQKLKEKDKQTELQDAVKKAVIESVLTGKGKFNTPVDMNQLVTGKGQLPDLNQFEATQDVSKLSALLGMKERAQKMEKERRLSVLGGVEPPSMEDVGQFLPSIDQGGPVAATSPMGGVDPGLVRATIGSMRKSLAPGIPREDLTRKALGMSTFKGGATQTQVVTLAAKLAEAENPMAGEREIQTKIPIAQKMLKGETFSGQPVGGFGSSQGEFTPEQEELIKDNMDAYPDKTEDEIIQALRDQGHL